MLNTGRLVQTLCLAVSCMNLKTRVEQFVQFRKLLIGCGGGGGAFDDDRLNAYVTAALARVVRAAVPIHADAAAFVLHSCWWI